MCLNFAFNLDNSLCLTFLWVCFLIFWSMWLNFTYFDHRLVFFFQRRCVHPWSCFCKNNTDQPPQQTRHTVLRCLKFLLPWNHGTIFLFQQSFMLIAADPKNFRGEQKSWLNMFTIYPFILLEKPFSELYLYLQYIGNIDVAVVNWWDYS